MNRFDNAGLQLSGIYEQQPGPVAESWRRCAAAMLMAAAALLLCGIVVVILAPLLPHAVTISHAAGLGVASMAPRARA